MLGLRLAQTTGEVGGSGRYYISSILAEGGMAGTAGVNDLISEPITWVSDDPHLRGNFAPVGPEIDAADLPVVAGRIPEGLSGAYLRNGSNPLFKPITYTYPFDGDGMIHAVYLEGGRARYRNRFVATRGLAVERRAGRAVYGGVMRPVPVDPDLVGKDGSQGTHKNGAFINVIRHGGKVLALCEATTGYEMTMDLETVGEWRAGTDAPIELGAHNRRHPRTGELFALTYAVDRPLVRCHRIGADGNLVATFPLELAAPTMIHDFVLTERYIVILACPLVFDLGAAMRGQPMLQWKPELGTRIAVVGLDGGTGTVAGRRAVLRLPLRQRLRGRRADRAGLCAPRATGSVAGRPRRPACRHACTGWRSISPPAGSTACRWRG